MREADERQKVNRDREMRGRERQRDERDRQRGETQRGRDQNERCINPPYTVNPFPGHIPYTAYTDCDFFASLFFGLHFSFTH